jgi:hypothetical protein
VIICLTVWSSFKFSPSNIHCGKFNFSIS